MGSPESVWIPVVAGVIVAIAGIPVARWLEEATYRKPDEVDDPVPARRWWVPLALGLSSALVLHRIWFSDRGPEISPWVGTVLSATLLMLVLSCVCLAAMDLDVHRLPDRIMWPTMGFLAAGLTLAALVGGGLDAWVRTMLGGLAAGAFYLLLALVSLARGSLSLGLGDVKLAVVLGAALGWFGWAEMITGIYAGFLVGGVVALALLAGRRVSWEGHFAFGPPMMVGALLGLLTAPTLLTALS
ncbi:prepilin peptidase [Ornithinimicrobium sp. Y1847]|uniref:prepilin peptidase n=1 Tax=unclassified Ornithinimicrobium TaxID=2615080 RepID=UPI003B67ADA0